MDNDKSMSIINNLGWDHTKPVNLQMKATLTQELILDEVMRKSERQNAALRRGLEKLGIMDLLLKYPQQMKELFVHKTEQSTYNQAKELPQLQLPHQPG